MRAHSAISCWLAYRAAFSVAGLVTAVPLFDDLAGQEPDRVVSGSVTSVLPVETFRLDNGLTVILSEDHSSPVMAVSVWYHVGGAHEFEGRTGLAHLLEHILGNRVRDLDVLESGRLLRDAGGAASADTDVDRTAYEMVVPSGALELALWIQAGRMEPLSLDGPFLGSAIDRVKAEGRVQIDGQPYARSQIVVDTLVTAYSPYKNSILGDADLEDIDVELVKRFHETYYVPTNAVLTVVGDVSRARAEDLAERYFGSFDERPKPPGLPSFYSEPDSASERRATVVDGAAGAPLLWVAYAVPEAVDEDLYALSLLSSVMSAGRSSRLQQVLVERTRVARNVISVLNRRRGPGSLLLGALPTEGTEPERLERVLLSVVDSIRAGGVTQAELEKAMNQRRASEVATRLTLIGRATELQRHQLYWGRAVRSNTELERYDAVTPEDILRVALRYLVAENRAVVLATPGGLNE